MNKILATGRLTHDPELAYLSNNTPKCSFSIAVDSGRKDANGEKITYFFNATAWNAQAEYLSRYTSKGNLIGIEGTLTQRTYTNKDGVNVNAVEIQCDRVENLTPRSDNDNHNQSQSQQQRQNPRDVINAQQDELPPSQRNYVVDDTDLPF